MCMLNIDLSDETIMNMDEKVFKQLVKLKARQHAFDVLRKLQNNHVKVKHIQYDNLHEPQQYLCNRKFNYKLSSLLFNLRC